MGRCSAGGAAFRVFTTRCGTRRGAFLPADAVGVLHIGSPAVDAADAADCAQDRHARAARGGQLGDVLGSLGSSCAVLGSALKANGASACSIVSAATVSTAGVVLLQRELTGAHMQAAVLRDESRFNMRHLLMAVKDAALAAIR